MLLFLAINVTYCGTPCLIVCPFHCNYLQLFWEKRLEGLRACDIDGLELDAMELPKGLKPVGPHVGDETLLQSVATALHVSTQPVTGQTGSRSALDRNPGVFLNPDQPLVQVPLHSTFPCKIVVLLSTLLTDFWTFYRLFK